MLNDNRNVVNNSNNRPVNNTRNNKYNKFDEVKRSEITDLVRKTLLVDYIYKTVVNMGRYKYKILEFEEDLSYLSQSNCNVSPNYVGIQSFLVFIRIDKVNYSYFVEKQKLPYFRAKVDINLINITSLELGLSDDIYNGTIIDGVMLYNNAKFIINDIFCFKGQSLLNDKIKYKLINISKYLEPFNTPLELVVNKLYELKNISNVVSTIIPASKLSNCIKGLTFYSDYSGMKLIYLYNNCSKDTVIKEPTNSSFVKNDDAENINIVCKIKDNHVANVRMKSMGIIDVYQLSLGIIIDKNDKKFIMYKPIGIAYIPTIECSVLCKTTCNTEQPVIMECRFIEETNKWVPVKLSSNTKPDMYNDIYDANPKK